MCWDQSKQYGEICMYTYGIVEFIYIYICYTTLINTAPFAPSYPHDIPIIIYVYPHDVQNFAWSKVSTVMALVSTVMAREISHSYHSCNN